MHPPCQRTPVLTFVVSVSEPGDNNTGGRPYRAGFVPDVPNVPREVSAIASAAIAFPVSDVVNGG